MFGRSLAQHEEPAERHNDTIPSNRSHNFQSIINQLPYELLVEIFTTICHDPDRFLAQDDDNRRMKTTPLVLGSVCSHWRIVVWNNTRIWSHLSLRLSSPSGRYSAQVSLLEAWLERSGVCPLTMSIGFHDEDEWTNEVAHDLIFVLAKQAYRWKSIDFVLPESWYPFLECTKDRLKQLTTVSMQPLWADCVRPFRRKRLTLFENAPLLNDVHLNGYFLIDVFLHWSQLTRMTLQHVYLDECFYVLPLIPNLTWCTIRTILLNDVNRHVVYPDPPIHLDQLKNFIVHRAAWGDLTQLLLSMSCVLLENLEISSLLDDLVIPQLSTVLPQFTTHPAALTRLILSDLTFTARPAFKVGREMKALLLDMPMLEELQINADWKKSAFCSWWFIDLLGVQDSGGELVVHETSVFLSPRYILPNLRSFTFTGSVVVHISEDTLSGSETTDKCACSHLASSHSSARVGKIKDAGFPRALLEVLSMRGGFGSEWLEKVTESEAKFSLSDRCPFPISPQSYATGSPSPNARPLRAKSAPLNLRNNLETFNFKATIYQSITGRMKVTYCERREVLAEVKAGLKRLREGGIKMKVVLGGEVWVR